MREAACRIFSNASGSYSSNVNLAVENSSWWVTGFEGSGFSGVSVWQTWVVGGVCLLSGGCADLPDQLACPRAWWLPSCADSSSLMNSDACTYLQQLQI